VSWPDERNTVEGGFGSYRRLRLTAGRVTYGDFRQWWGSDEDPTRRFTYVVELAVSDPPPPLFPPLAGWPRFANNPTGPA